MEEESLEDIRLSDGRGILPGALQKRVVVHVSNICGGRALEGTKQRH